MAIYSIYRGSAGIGRGSTINNTLFLASFDADKNGVGPNTVVFTGTDQTGTPTLIATPKFGTNSLQLNSTSEEERWDTFDTEFTVETSWTVEFWFSKDGAASPVAQCALFNAGGGFNSVILQMDGAANTIIGQVRDSSNILFYNSGAQAFTFTNATFFHIALVRDAIADTYSTYAEGNRLHTANNATDSAIADYLRVIETANSLQGALFDEIRISNIARYSGATYTIPTTAFVVD
jgi:hypothetical protein